MAGKYLLTKKAIPLLKLNYQKHKIFITLSFLCIFSNFALKAQDPHFSQFYAAPLYINPAFTGSAPEGRFTFNYRAQWPKLPGEFFTYQAGYEHNFQRANSSLGVMAILDQAGSAGIRSTNIHISYAYDLTLDKEWALKAGLQIGYGSRGLDYYKLVFGDQLSSIGSNGNPTQDPSAENLNINYIDASSGFVLYSENFWLGISGHHLNQPNQSFTLTDEKLPMQISVQTGYKIPFYKYNKSKNDDPSASLTPSLYYSQQGKFKQLDVGLNGFLDPVIAGIWYRGVPIQKSYNGAVVLMTGFKYKYLRFLYSFDTAVGKFSTVTGGAHEISMSLTTGSLQRKKKYRRNKKSPDFPSFVE